MGLVLSMENDMGWSHHALAFSEMLQSNMGYRSPQTFAPTPVPTVSMLFSMTPDTWMGTRLNNETVAFERSWICENIYPVSVCFNIWKHQQSVKISTLSVSVLTFGNTSSLWKLLPCQCLFQHLETPAVTSGLAWTVRYLGEVQHILGMKKLKPHTLCLRNTREIH